MGTKVQYAKIWTDSELTCDGRSILQTFIFFQNTGQLYIVTPITTVKDPLIGQRWTDKNILKRCTNQQTLNGVLTNRLENVDLPTHLSSLVSPSLMVVFSSPQDIHSVSLSPLKNPMGHF